MPKTLATLLLASAATLSLSAAALAQTQPSTPPSAPPPGEGVKPGAVPKGQQPPVIDPAEVPPTQGDTVAPPAAEPAPPSGVVPATPATPGVAPATPASPATGATTLVNGASVKDAQGNAIGTIQKVGTGSNAGEVTLSIDGKTVTVAQSVLSETGGAVVSSQTKAQLLAQADPKKKAKKE
jgi:hypothetical protein